MNVHCADCDHSFLLTPDGATQSAACPSCGGKRLERDQPSPTESDGNLRNVPDPSNGGIDSGGNPHQEGIWGQVDGGWQPWIRRDESYASVKTAGGFDFGDGGFDFGEKTPTHKFVVDSSGGVYSLPEPTTHEAVADAHGLHDLGFPKGQSLGELYDNGETGWFQHETTHSPEALSSMLYGHFGQPVTIDPNLRPTTNEERWDIPLTDETLRNMRRVNPDRLQQMQQVVQQRGRPFPHYENPYINRGGSVDRALNQEPYLPWTHEAEVKEAEVPEASVPQHTAVVTPGPHGIHAGTIKWLQFLDAAVNGRSARQDPNGMFAEHGMHNSPNFGQPVTVAVHHPEHLPGAIDTIETSAQGSTPAPRLKELALAISQGMVPPPPGIDPSKLRFGSIKTAGPAAGIGLSTLMRGALFGAGSHMVQGLLGGNDSGGSSGGSPGASMPPPPRDPSMLSSVHEADLETPHGNPGYYHDDPEAIDQHEFQDGSTDPNFNNPTVDGEAGGAQTGEDNVAAQWSPGTLERAQALLPLILHYYHSDESGANDPLIKALHEQLETEQPGYLDKSNDDAAKQLLLQLRQPDSVHARVADIGYPAMTGPNVLNTPQNAAPTQAVPGPPAQTTQQGICPYCGGTVTADGSCPQCGAKMNPMGGAIPPGGQATGPMPYGGMPNAIPRSAATHQGPVTDEQKSAVAELLITEGRQDEIPAMLMDPSQYAREMAEVAHRINQPPNVDPNDPQPPQPAQEIAPPGATMPVPNPADPSQQMAASVRTATPHNAAPRCPKCGSATTGFVHNGVGDMNGQCHACGNLWKLDNDDAGVARTAAEPLNPEAVPAAEHHHRLDDSGDTDSSHTWQDDNGQPLVEGGEYEMHSPSYQIPDIVRIDKIKPDSILVSTIGEYSNEPTGDQPLAYQHEITKEEIDLQNLTFTPSDGSSQAGDQSLENYQDASQAPVNTEPTPAVTNQPEFRGSSFQRFAPLSEYDQYFGGKPGAARKAKENMIKEYGAEKGEEVFYATVNTKKKQSAEREAARVPDPEVAAEPRDDMCPHCRSSHIASQMSSPTTEFHECYKCGHAWETKEEDYMEAGSERRSWVLGDDGHGDDFFSEMERVRQMRASGTSGSRNIQDIASRDERYQAIKEHLDAEHEARTAGKKFTPREQRELIDERGNARNADKLDLAGTHYESHRYLDKANGENVPDTHLFMGL